MTSIEHGDDIHNKIIAEILKLCTDGCREQKIMEQTNMSHDQLRENCRMGHIFVILYLSIEYIPI
jgi:hypothetical protein